MEDFLTDISNSWFNLAALIISGVVVIVGLQFICFNPRLFGLILKNLRRNKLRTALTSLAIMVLVLMATMILTIINFLDRITTEKAKNFRLIVTERWQIPSQMPLSHGELLNPESSGFLKELQELNIIGPGDYMTWSFYGGTLDGQKLTPENLVFFFCMNPDHIRTMMDDLDTLDLDLIEKMKKNPQSCLMGLDRLNALNKKVGEKIKIKSLNYKGIDLELEVVGTLPEGRYDKSAILNDRYFNEELDKYRRTNNGAAHPLDKKRLNLIWLRVPDREAFDKIGKIIEDSPSMTDPQVKVETESSGVGNFLDAYKDLLKGMKYLVVPAILICIGLVISNAISISVRERRTEMAVLKVLGFRPNQILDLVIGESILVGSLSGLFASAAALVLVNVGLGGIKFPVAFFPAFMIPTIALAWGMGMGALTAFLGSTIPGWTASNVQVSEVFAKVA